MTITIPPKHERDRDRFWRDFCKNAEDYVAESTRHTQKEEARIVRVFPSPARPQSGFTRKREHLHLWSDPYGVWQERGRFQRCDICGIERKVA